jgi:hypothetical protein
VIGWGAQQPESNWSQTIEKADRLLFSNGARMPKLIEARAEPTD